MATHIAGFIVTDDIIDTLARAAYEATARKTGSRFTPWREASPRFHETFRDQVAAALEALATTQRVPVDCL